MRQIPHFNIPQKGNKKNPENIKFYVIILSSIIISQINYFSMCFIKKPEYAPFPVYEPCGNNCHCHTYHQTLPNPIVPFYNAPFIWSSPIPQNSLPHNPFAQQLQMIFNRIKLNNQIIETSFQKLQQNQRQLLAANKYICDFYKQEEIRQPSQEDLAQHQDKEVVYFNSSSAIVNKIFGNKPYKYRIKALTQFPKIIYKQRNLHISIQLITKQGRLIRNANLIHLCIAVCDQNGKWIIGQDDDFFIKGKVQVDLFRGESEFKKIYPKDISRHFPGGKVNIIIYPKPSILATTTPLPKGQQLIDCDEVEPLLISNVLIKAKKKMHY